MKSLYFQKQKSQQLQEENASHVDADNITQTREDSGPKAEHHLGHELVTTVS